MKKIAFLLVILIFVSLNGLCQDNIFFPLEIGNRFFYQAGHYPDNGYYGSIKTITDSLADGTRIISVNKFYNDSTNFGTEYWLF